MLLIQRHTEVGLKAFSVCALVAAVALLVAGCSGSANSGGPPTTSATQRTTTTGRGSGSYNRSSSTAGSKSATNADLRTAALAWSKAFLTGTPEDIARMQGPECAANTSTTFSEHFLTMYLQAEREVMRRHFGVDPGAIKIRGVLVRNVTANRGEAEVQYELPESTTGNYNWVTYELLDGRWKVADCHAPIGGSASSASSATAPSTDTTGTVVGTLREVGGPSPGLNRQIPGTVYATDASGTRWLAATTATQPFSLSLPGGTYRLTGRSPLINTGQTDCLPQAPVVVVGGKTTQVEVECGIP